MSFLQYFIVSFIAGSIVGWAINGWRLDSKIDHINTVWNEAYTNQTKTVLDQERKNQELNNQIEVDNAEQAKQIDVAHAVNIKLSNDIKRMQQSASGSSSPMSKNNGSCQCAGSTTAHVEFSAESNELLVEMAKQADDAARYANNCHKWATQIIENGDE